MQAVREEKVDIGGKRYIITSDDEYLNRIKHGFEPEMVKLFKIMASNSRTVLDVGANIGCTALLFADLSQWVYAFEPSKSTFTFLEKNITRAGKKNIIPLNIGLGAASYETTLTFHPSNRSGGFVSNLTQADAEHNTEKISIQRLDDVVNSLDLQQIDFIKLDVEGFEAQALHGAKQTLVTHRPTVVLELNHWCLNAFQRTSIPDFFDFLRSQFPILFAIDNACYMNLHDAGESYSVMYYHILQMRFPNILAAFEEDQVSRFQEQYRHGFEPDDGLKPGRAKHHSLLTRLLRLPKKR